MMGRTIALIPARGGSKGVVDKNIKSLGGYPLIAYSIAAAKLSKNIHRTIVSTDSEKIAAIAKSFGAEVPFLRPADISTDKSPDKDFVLHAIQWFKDHEQQVPEYLVHLRPTTPFRDPAIIDQAIDLITSTAKSSSLRSGHPASESPFKWFLRNDQGYFKSISPEYSIEATNQPRQSFPPVFIPDGYVDVLKTSFVSEHKTIHGEQMLGFISPVCHEVDTIQDFEYLEFEIAQRGSPLLDYLKKNYPMAGRV